MMQKKKDRKKYTPLSRGLLGCDHGQKTTVVIEDQMRTLQVAIQLTACHKGHSSGIYVNLSFEF